MGVACLHDVVEGVQTVPRDVPRHVQVPLGGLHRVPAEGGGSERGWGSGRGRHVPAQQELQQLQPGR